MREVRRNHPKRNHQDADRRRLQRLPRGLHGREVEAGGSGVLNIISLGAGVQSSTMALMAAHGEITPIIGPDSMYWALLSMTSSSMRPWR